VSTPTSSVDPITQQVVQSNLISIVDEMETNMTRTAYSPIVYEVKDLCAALLDVNCRIIAQARGGMPIFLADLGAPVRAGVEHFGLDGFRPGDVVLTNEPTATGQHLNNVVAFSPVFADDALIGFAAVRAHWADIGGGVPSSFSTVSTDIHAEGLIIDGVKIVKEGRVDPQIRRLIASNIRYPVESLGDMRAQIAACRVGERRLVELVDRYGADTVFAAIDHIWLRSETATRRKIAETADGVYHAESFLDNDGINDEPVFMRVRVEVRGDEITADLSESSPQVAGNINCGASAAIAAVRVAFKSFTSPDSPADEGSFRPLKVILPEGRFLSARKGAAMSQWSASIPQLIDTVLLALSQADPARVPAGHHGSLAPFIWVGQTRAGRPFVHIDTCCGGWGGGEGHDGGSGLKSYMHGDTHNVPIEIEEAMFPLRIASYTLVPDSGGAGRWRGGLASAKRYVPLTDVSLNFSFPRSRCPPWGRSGGRDGVSDRLEQYDVNGELIAVRQSGTMLPCPAGSSLVMVSGSGGGLGNATERDRDGVGSDLRNGYITPAAAGEIYEWRDERDER
jgi:N-methylhydantoinase B